MDNHECNAQGPLKTDTRGTWPLDLEAQGDMVMVGASNWNRRWSWSNVSHGLCLSEIVKGPVKGELGQGNPFLLFNLLDNIYLNMFPSRLYQWATI